ncbi:hypothetical protein MNBD_IGNAVI01-2332 [hydrothermal vent metagenome]|uniref:Outer membrane protein beta-barrel domain-containing protein n=1 Tax=hydrothermal vent metagenome TaxID=652676 RepID=A0A3B1C3M1_9ZZZZ
MKKIVFILLVFFVTKNISAQVDIAAGMGISFLTNSSLNDYFDAFFPSENKMPAFSSTAEFYLEADFSVTPTFQLGVEDVYTLYSYNTSIGFTNYELEYGHHKPSLLGYYVINGEGYKFKFGGGAGIRIVDLSEKITITENYSTIGYGFLLRAQGHTKLGGNFYANVGGTMRFDFPGEPANGERTLHNSIINENVNINSFSVSVDIGVSYFF